MDYIHDTLDDHLVMLNDSYDIWPAFVSLIGLLHISRHSFNYPSPYERQSSKIFAVIQATMESVGSHAKISQIAASEELLLKLIGDKDFIRFVLE